MDKGIDYSDGIVNRDKDTGIHYGVISQHSIMSEAMENFEYDYGKPTCPKCGNELVDYCDKYNEDNSIEDFEHYSKYDSEDYVCLDCKLIVESESAFSDEPLGFSYEGDGYQLIDCLDTDIMIIKSPYFTYTQFCSPCVPGAGNLDTYIKDGVKTYALGHDWFEDGKAPYPLYDVKTGNMI